MSKIDLVNDFYCLWLSSEDTYWLAMPFLSWPGELPLVGIPLTNPMGWSSSPPNFCPCTKMVTDLVNAALQDPAQKQLARVTPLLFDKLSETAPADASIASASDPHNPSWSNRISLNPFKLPLSYWNIYIDDVLWIGAGNMLDGQKAPTKYSNL